MVYTLISCRCPSLSQCMCFVSTRYTNWKELAHLLEEVGIDANSLLGSFAFAMLLVACAAALACIVGCSCLTLKVALYFEQCIDESDNEGCRRSLLCENGEDLCHKWKKCKEEQGGLTKADIPSYFAPHYVLHIRINRLRFQSHLLTHGNKHTQPTWGMRHESKLTFFASFHHPCNLVITSITNEEEYNLSISCSTAR